MALRNPPTALGTDRPPLRIAVYGTKGIGKSTFGLTAPHPIVLNSDDSLEGEAIPVDPDVQVWVPDTYRDLNDFARALPGLKAEGREFLVIDTGNALARFLVGESVDTYVGATRQAGAGEREIGKVVPEKRDYGALAMAFERFLLNLRPAKMDTLILFHTRQPNPEEGLFLRTVDLPAATRKVATEWANILGEYTLTKDGKRQIAWSPTAADHEAGNRWQKSLGAGMAEPTIPKILRVINRVYEAQKGAPA